MYFFTAFIEAFTGMFTPPKTNKKNEKNFYSAHEQEKEFIKKSRARKS